MALWTQILLHGANSKTNSDVYSQVALTTVAALTGYALVTLNVMKVRPYATYEGSTEDGVGGVKVETSSTQRTTYSIELERFDFNNSTDTATYNTLAGVLRKKYLFLSGVDYPKALNSTSCVTDVVRTGYETEDEPGYLTVTMELQKRKANPNE